jgi:flavin-dependent dehydrogenase
MIDVLVAGAGPAGAVAALVLARAGARVLIVDRETFPRDKLCGDTVNPGALDLLRSHDLGGGPLDSARRLDGMVLSGPRAQVVATYGPGVSSRAVRRRELDLWLLERAIQAGARFESALVVRAPLLAEESGPPIVRGLTLAPRGRPQAVSRFPARLVIAADGGRSTLARGLGLLRAPSSPRRWAFGTYAAGVADVGDFGEMHVRGRWYVGIAPLDERTANVCVVTAARPAGRTPLDVMKTTIACIPELAERFQRAAFTKTPRVLGPLAADSSGAGVEGLLLAGDAAGFVDPLTGDGLHLAIRGAILAAEEALRTLETSDFCGAPRRLAQARRETLGSKLRFNRAARLVSGSSSAIRVASGIATIAPAVIRRVVRYAGDVGS